MRASASYKISAGINYIGAQVYLLMPAMLFIELKNVGFIKPLYKEGLP